jgi:hypothetical protein
MDPIARGTSAVPDPARRLREFALAERRRALAPPGTRLLSVTAAAEATALPDGEGVFDAAWLAPESLAGIDLPALGSRVARGLRSGARLLCVIPGAWPLPAVVERGLLGLGGRGGQRRRRVEGCPSVRTSVSEWRQAFGREFAWRAPRAMGVLLPASAGWAPRHPLAFGLLAAAEQVVAGWPVLRALGDQIVLEGVRR